MITMVALRSDRSQTIIETAVPSLTPHGTVVSHIAGLKGVGRIREAILSYLRRVLRKIRHVPQKKPEVMRLLPLGGSGRPNPRHERVKSMTLFTPRANSMKPFSFFSVKKGDIQDIRFMQMSPRAEQITQSIASFEEPTTQQTSRAAPSTTV